MMMLSLRDIWRRHRRKLLFSIGTIGGGYLLYKIYDAHTTRAAVLEKQLEGTRVVDELIKSHLQNHFENIQRISDSTTLPYAVLYLRSQIAESLDPSFLMEKLRQSKGQSDVFTIKEKAELWEMLKVLSFTRLATSLWSITALCLFVRVQVNILGRNLYIGIARCSESSQMQDEVKLYNRHSQHDFLATADYLSTYGINLVIRNMQNASTEVLKDKLLKDTFCMEKLREMIIGILEMFMGMVAPSHWISYLVPEDIAAYRQMMPISSSCFEDSSIQMDANNLEQLVSEMRAVLSSQEFIKVMRISMSKLVDVIVEDIREELSGATSSSNGGIPLVTLLPRVIQMGPRLLEEPISNKFILAVQNLPEVDLFYTLLYANMQHSS